MSWAFVRREWGAVTFVLTVLIGMVVVPVALYFTNVSPSPVTTPPSPSASSVRASGVTAPTPTPTKSP